MSREEDLAILETQISNLRARAKELDLSLLAHLLAMAQLELTEYDAKCDSFVRLEDARSH